MTNSSYFRCLFSDPPMLSIGRGSLPGFTQYNGVVTLACRDALAQSGDYINCSSVDFSSQRPTCQLLTRQDTWMLRLVARISGEIGVMYHIFTYYVARIWFSNRCLTIRKNVASKQISKTQSSLRTNVYPLNKNVKSLILYHSADVYAIW